MGIPLEQLPGIGVFASRSPHRPNPIALTLVRLHRVKGTRLWVSGLDLFDRTPILDLKPYTPSWRIEPTVPSWYEDLARAKGIEFSL
ncbi:MAG: TrmO family methyltransferase domain-containing protein [Thermaceae bacterium]